MDVGNAVHMFAAAIAVGLTLGGFIALANSWRV